jgi:murein DD-endopeptidase MepM/ murein hydrolase activator NlpD
MRRLRTLALFWLCAASSAVSADVQLQGEAIQGGLMFGKAEPGSTVSLDGAAVMVGDEGHFVIGFGRDETGTRTLRVTGPGGEVTSQSLAVAKREYDIERVDGLPPSTVTPDPSAADRIKEETRMVRNARAHRDQKAFYAGGFTWPAKGRISGVYGSQRVLNGEPRRPHYGVDIAAPTGTEVVAPADGLVTLTHPDMYYSGGTIVLDHGQGLSSSFLHLSEILVEAGTFVKQGEVIALIGATGRATGPHLDWRMNWLDRRVDPQPLVTPKNQ